MQQPPRKLLLLALAGLAACSLRAAVPPLSDTDVGSPSQPGSLTVTTDATGKVYTVVGGGNDIWNASDNFHYAYFKVTGNFDYIVKVQSLEGNANDGGWSKAELMAREDDGSGTPQGGDRHISNMATRTGGQNEVALQFRLQARDGGSAWPPDIGLNRPITRPNFPNCWLRLRREGSLFIGYYSGDGTAWTELNRVDTAKANGSAAAPPDGPFANSILLGLAVTAHSDADTSKGVFSNFDAHVAVPVAIVTQPPATVSIAANKPLELKVVATGDPVRYQWRKGGTDIAGATADTFKIDLAQTTDSGTYTVRVYGDANEAVSSSTVVTVTADTEPPTIAKVSPDESFTQLVVTFSEPVDATGEAAGNYTLDKSVTVSSATRLAPAQIRLTIGKMAEGTEYTLTVNNVKDTASPANTIAANTKIKFKSFLFWTGACLQRYWDNVTQNNIAGLTGDTRFPDSPTFVTVEPRWEYGRDGNNENGSNYGNQLTGWFIPATSGSYVFFTCSDDPSDLYLSTDETRANKKLIAQEAGWSNARNWVTTGSGDVTMKRSDQFANTEWPGGSTITLQAGKRYYMESLHTEGGGGDNVGATFILAGEADPKNGDAPKLAGSLIGTYVDPNGVTLGITQQPQSVTILENTAASFSVGATSSWSGLTYQWQKAPAGGAFTDITGANKTNYTTPPLPISDNGSRYRVVVSAPGQSLNSAEATATIQGDSLPPTLVSALRKFSDNTKVTVTFSELIQAASANTAGNYSINNGIGVTAAALAADGKSVVLTVSAIAKGSVNTLTVSGVKDLAGNSIAAGAQIPIGFQRGALFVLTNDDPPTVNASDGAIKARLEARGYDVEIVGSTVDDASMATGKDLVVLSSTFSSGNVTDTYKNVPVPVIEWEQAIQDDMAMTTVTGTTDRGTTTGLRTIEIVDATHPMAAGLPAGPLTVVTADSEFAWGQPAATAQVVAKLVGTGNACIYGYDKGALLTDGTAAAERRILFFMTDNVAAVMTEAAFKLFDAAVDWAQHLAVAQPQPQITSVGLANGNISIKWSNGGTLQSTSSLKPPITWTPETGNGSFSAPATGPAKFYRVSR